jgi:hypothetical protein
MSAQGMFSDITDREGMFSDITDREGMFANIYDDRQLLDLYAIYNKGKTCTPDGQHEGMTKECLIYLLNEKYNLLFKKERNLPQYVRLSPFVDKDRHLASSIINTDSWQVYGYKPDTEEYEYDSRLENQFYYTSYNSSVPLRKGSKEMVVVVVRPYYLSLLRNLEQNISGVDPAIRASPMQPVELQPVEPPMQPMQPPISVSISPPPRPNARPDALRPAPPGPISKSIGGDRHKRAQIKAKSSKKRAQKKSSKKRINKNKNKRRTRSRKVLK